jgi:subtilisin family serine protease
MQKRVIKLKPKQEDLIRINKIYTKRLNSKKAKEVIIMSSETKNDQLKVYAVVTLLSNEGTSVLRKSEDYKIKRKKRRKRRDLPKLRPSQETFDKVKSELKKSNFKITAEGAFNVVISSSKDNFEKVFNVKLKEQEEPVFLNYKEPKQKYYITSIDIQVPETLISYVDQISLCKPIKYLAESAIPPQPNYHHFNVPVDIESLINATQAHNEGWTGKGVEVIMIDSGFYYHNYYKNKGYIISVFDDEGNEKILDDGIDYVGHGTAMASCLLAVAPGVNFRMIYPQYGFQSIQTFLLAIGMEPHIITLSGGPAERDEAFEIEIEIAISLGIVVTVACGNLGWINSLATIPGVISVGGVYVDDTGQRFASNYASSGYSEYYNREFPDVCGITGTRVMNITFQEGSVFCDPPLGHITIPTQPFNSGDQYFASGTCDSNGVLLPDGVDEDEAQQTEYTSPDGTLDNDGWVVASGTSSAAPMVAGVAALLLEKGPNLTPYSLKSILQATAKDIISGTTASGDTSTSGYDRATGYGLVDAYGAIHISRINKVRLFWRKLIMKILPPRFRRRRSQYGF